MLKTRPALFDASGMHVEQLFARSKDGTRVPYFVVWPRGLSAPLRRHGDLPTLLYGYGGFEISMNPVLLAARSARAWLRARAASTCSPTSAAAASSGRSGTSRRSRRTSRSSYDDFIAVAEDLIARKFTTPKHLGIEGGSNGGLLVGAVMVTSDPTCSTPSSARRRCST